MLTKLKGIEQRLDAVEAQLSDPSVYGDPVLLKKLRLEQKDLTPVVEAYRAYCRAEQTMAEAEELLGDPELREVAAEELTMAKAERERLAGEIGRAHV